MRKTITKEEKDLTKHNKESEIEKFEKLLSNLNISSRDEQIKKFIIKIMKNNSLFKELDITQEILNKESHSKETLINNLIYNIQNNPAKRIVYLRFFLDRFPEISEQDKNLILQSIGNDIKEVFFSKKDKKKERGPYPSIFKPPEPPRDLGVAPQLQVKKSIYIVPENEVYCQYCGMKLSKEGKFSHNCRKSPDKNRKMYN